MKTILALGVASLVGCASSAHTFKPVAKKYYNHGATGYSIEARFADGTIAQYRYRAKDTSPDAICLTLHNVKKDDTQICWDESMYRRGIAHIKNYDQGKTCYGSHLKKEPSCTYETLQAAYALVGKYTNALGVEQHDARWKTRILNGWTE